MKTAKFRCLFPLALAVGMLLLPARPAAAGCGVIKPDATDAVAAAPENHKVILENEMVRVLEARVPLHSREVPHTHFWPSVFFEQTSGPTQPAFETVNIRWSTGGPSKGFASSDRDRHNLLIELKDTDCQPAKLDPLPSTDAVALHDPNMTVVLENPYVRVLSVRVPPGAKEPWHTHTWPAVVVYFRLPPSRRLAPDGASTSRAELKEMQVTFDPHSQPLHSVENLGKVPYQAYRIELKPVTKIPLTHAAVLVR
ncbi:MAG TPA: hypothetical protein VKV17_05380 [Bryobacteraceae bacterium]|nr:hypothetical protein [Bryobacteraceae bacterium]